MADSSDEVKFRLRCNHCGRIVFSDVARLSVLEVRELLVHLTVCRPDLSLAENELGKILAHFDAQKVY